MAVLPTDLDGAPALVVAPDHRIELALPGALGQVDGEALQRLAGVLGRRVVDLLATAQLIHRLLHGALDGAGLAQGLGDGSLVVQQRQQEQFAADEPVSTLLGELVGDVEEPDSVVAEQYFAGVALDLGQRIELLAESRAQCIHLDAGAAEQVPGRTALLVQQRNGHVHGLDELMVATDGQRLGVGQRHLKLGR